jgi:group I intron endonuclease
LLTKEQIYIDLLFRLYPSLNLNLSPTAGSTLGFKHKPEFGLKRSGSLNPMAGREYSKEFITMQKRSKLGINNPLYGTTKSATTIEKLIKLVYVYDSITMKYLGSYSTVQCSKELQMGKDTLSKYINNGLPLKGKIFSRIKLHNS